MTRTDRCRRPAIACLLAAVLLTLAAPALLAQANDAAQRQYVLAYRLLQRKQDAEADKAFETFLNRWPNDEKKADALYYRALIAYQKGDPVAASRHLDAAGDTAIVPDHMVHLLKAEIRLGLKQPKEAIKSLEQIAVDKLGDDMRARVLYRRGSTYYALQNFAAAETNFDQAAKPTSAIQGHALLALGQVRKVLKKNDEAVASFKKAAEMNNASVSPEAAFLAGELSYKSGKHAQAIALFRTVVTKYQSSRRFGQAATGIMWAQLASKQYQDVIQSRRQFNDALTGGDRVTAVYVAAAAHQQQGQNEEAVTLLKSIQLSARNTSLDELVLWRLARGQYHLEQFDDMSKTVQELNTRHAKSRYLAEVEYLRASSLAIRGKNSEADARLSEVITKGQSHPYYSKALLQRAKVRENEKLLEQAAADYTLYLKLFGETKDPGVAVAALRLTELRSRLSGFKEAVEAARQLLAQENLDPAVEQEAMFRLAGALRETKQYDEAYDAYDALLKKYPQNKHANRALAWRGLLLMAKNRPDAAVPDLTKAAQSGALDASLGAKVWRMIALRQRQTHDDKRAAAALAELEKLIGVNELTTKEMIWLGRYHLRAGAPRQTLHYVRPLIKSATAPKPVKSEAVLLSANATRELGDLPSAITLYQEVIAIGGGGEKEAQLELARTLVESKRFEEAHAAFESLYRANNTPTPIVAASMFESAVMWRDVARQWADASDPVKAKEANGKARELLVPLVVLHIEHKDKLSPLLQKGLIELAEVDLLLDRAKDAAKWYTELSEKFEKEVYGTYGKAMAAALDNRRGDAVFLLRKLREQEMDKDLTARVRDALKRLESAG